MKKKNLKSLSLNKTVISNLNQEQVKGGTGVTTTLGTGGTIIILATKNQCHSNTCITTVYDGPLKPTCGNC